MLNSKLFNQNSYYSRSNLEKKRNISNPINLDVLFNDLKSSNPFNDFNILTLNLNRFPKNNQSCLYFCRFILKTMPDLICLQEVENCKFLKRCLKIINSICGEELYRVFFSNDVYNNTRLAIVFLSSTITDPVFRKPFIFDSSLNDFSFHIPLLIKFFYLDQPYFLFNFHLPSLKNNNRKSINDFIFRNFNYHFIKKHFFDHCFFAGDFNMDYLSFVRKLNFTIDPIVMLTRKHCFDFVLNRFPLKNSNLLTPKSTTQLTGLKLNKMGLNKWNKNLSDHFPVFMNFEPCPV